MLPAKNIQSIIGATLYGPDDVKLGRISQVLVDAADGHPTWAEVHVGTLGRHTTYVPLDQATWEHDDVYVPYDKDLVKNAPQIDGDGGLSPEQESELGRYYSGERGGVPSDSDGARASVDDSTADAPHDAAPAQQLDENGVLWEERVVVMKKRVPVAKVHLETTTVTENQEVTADVQKERVVVEQTDTPEPPR
jgi:hypothetical protein